jgi:hypothetical protein
LGDGFPEEVKNIINPVLNKFQCDNVLNQLGCSSGFEYSKGKNIEYKIDINFINDNLLGFNTFSSWYCGGTHPDFGGQGTLLDLKSGEEYTIDDILAFDKSVTVENSSNFTKFSSYRALFFAPKLYQIINKTEFFQKPDSDEGDVCDYTSLEIWNFPSWNFTEDGIEFTPIFDRAMRSCEASFLVKFEDLKKYKKDSFPYNF